MPSENGSFGNVSSRSFHTTGASLGSCTLPVVEKISLEARRSVWGVLSSVLHVNVYLVPGTYGAEVRVKVSNMVRGCSCCVLFLM